MSRFLVATMPIPGHVAPFTPLVRKLVDRGHEVVWYGSRFFADKIADTGATFAPIRSTVDFGDGDYDRWFPERTGYSGLKQVVWDFEHIFVGAVEGYVTDLRALAAEHRPDVLLADPAVVAAHVLERVDGIPAATLNVTVLGLQSPDVPPFGLGLGPGRNPLTRLRNRALYPVVDHVVFRPVNRAYRKLATRHGWPILPFRPTATRALYLQPSVPKLEYPDSRLPAQVHFVGPLLPRSGAFTPPVWWDDVLAARAARTPIVVVTQGTIATDPTELIQPTLRALADKDVLVIAAGAEQSALDVPANARVALFVPFTELLPLVDAYVTNGGYGGVTIALANGVPVVSGGTTEDKPDVGARVAHSGAGVNLRTNRPSEEKIRSSVGAILDDPRYRAAAQRIQRRFAQHDAPAEAADLLERLATAKSPVLAGR